MYQSKIEILCQADALQKTVAEIEAREVDIQSFFAHKGDVVLIACGSSYWASLSAYKTLMRSMGRRVFAVKAGDVLMNPDEYTSAYHKPILLLPSRSGATTEQLEALHIFKEAYKRVPVLSIVVYENSSLEKLSDVSVNIPWANEISVCQTRSFSCLYLAMVAIAGLYDDELMGGIKRYVQVSECLSQRDFPRIEAIVANNSERNHMIAIGSGRQYGVVIEGAYIGVEMAQIMAGYYGVMELRHGPIVTVSNKTILAICSMGAPLALEEQIVREAVHYGAHSMAVVANGTFDSANDVFSMDGDYPPEAVALHYVFLMQAYAYFTAVARKLDPDNPGELVRYIQITT